MTRLHYNIALVDDQEMTRITLGSLLEKRLHANVLLKANSAKELLLYLKKGEQPDLVITDLAMPEMGGVTLCKKLKSLYPDLKILVLSVYKEQPVINKLMQMGVDGFVNKDMNVDDLINAVREVLEKEEVK